MSKNLTCPECGTDRVVVYEMHAVMANTFEHYCHSVKAYDANAKARCFGCGWTGERQHLAGYGEEHGDEQKRNASGASLFSVGLEGTCKKCCGAMKPGKAIAQTWTGLPDFPGDDHCVTVSPGGSGKLIDCVKCEKCGWSMTSNAPAQGPSGFIAARPME